MDELTRGIKVVEFIVTETGSYNDQFHRPWQFSATEEDVESLYEKIEDRKLKISNKLFTGENSGIIRPAGDVDSKIVIPSGWDERRNRFTMTLEVTSATGMRLFQVVRGFTDHLGVLVRGERALFDEDMRFYVNSITNIKPRRVNGRIENIIEDVSHLLYSIDAEDTRSYYSRESHEERLRPEDLFTHMSRASFDRELGDSNSFDESTINQSTPVKASAVFSLPATYASKVLSSFQSASMNSSFGSTQADIINDAINAASEASLMNDVFMRALRNEARSNRAYFTLRSISRIDPHYREPDYVPYGNQDIDRMSRAGQSSSWGASTIEAQAAVQIAQGVPAIMARFGFVAADFSCQNMRTRSFTGGEREWFNKPGSYMKATGMEAGHHEFLNMIDLVVEEIIEPLTNRGMYDIDVYINCNLSGDTIIDLSFDGAPDERFIQPTFASALLSPLVTGRREHARQMASDFNALTTSLFQLSDYDGEDIYVGDEGSAPRLSYDRDGGESSPFMKKPSSESIRGEPSRKFQNSGISGSFASDDRNLRAGPSFTSKSRNSGI